MQRQLQLAAGGDDHRLCPLLQPHLGRLGQHVGALGDLVEPGLRRIGQVLPAQQQRARAFGIADGDGPGHCGFGRVGRAPDVQVRDQPQRRGMFHALVRGAVFAQADAVVREDMDHAPLHQRGHADGVAAVVAEGQEGAAVGNEAAVQRDAVHHRGHAELAHAVVDVAPAVGGAVLAEAQGRRGTGVGQVRSGQVGRAAQQLGQGLGEGFQHDLAGLARGHGFRLGVRGDDRVDHGLRKVLRQLAAHAPLQRVGQLGKLGAVGGEAGDPVAFGRFAPRLVVPQCISRFGHDKGLAIPAERGARQRDFFDPQCFAMRLGRAGAVGRALADGGLADDQRRPGRRPARLGQGGIHRLHVVAVDRPDDVPAIGLETLRHVVHVPGLDGAVDADAVVVVQRHQLVQLPGPGQRADLVADAFHHAAVAQEDVGAMVHDGMAGAVELGRQQLFGQRHADRVADALAQRAGGGFHPRGQVHLRMPRGLAVQLAEVAQLAHRQVVAAQVQQRIQQHRGVAVGQHETVAVGPVRVARVVFQVPVP